MAAKTKKESKLSEVIAALPTLTEKELAAVKAAITLLSKKKGPGHTVGLFEAITRTLEINMSWAFFENTVTCKDFEAAAPDVLDFAFEICKDAGKVQQQGILRFLIGLLVSDLKARKIPVTLGTVCRNLNTVPMVFDSAFPDYRRSSLMPMLLKQMVRK
jgi:hypothetical protein